MENRLKLNQFWSYKFTPENIIGKSRFKQKKVESYELKQIYKKLKSCIKIDKNIIKFDDTEIKEYKFHQIESPLSINDIDINKIVVSNKVLFGKEDFKYFIGYKDPKIRPLCIFCSEMSIYKRDINKTKCMYFMIKEIKSFW